MINFNLIQRAEFISVLFSFAMELDELRENLSKTKRYEPVDIDVVNALISDLGLAFTSFTSCITATGFNDEEKENIRELAENIKESNSTIKGICNSSIVMDDVIFAVDDHLDEFDEYASRILDVVEKI